MFNFKNSYTILLSFVLIFFVCVIKVTSDIYDSIKLQQEKEMQVKEQLRKTNLEIQKRNREVEITNHNLNAVALLLKKNPEFENNIIFDAWNEKINIFRNHKKEPIRLISSGFDRERGTKDDIYLEIENKKSIVNSIKSIFQ